MTKTWTAITAQGIVAEIKIKTGGTDEAYLATAKALQAGGFTTIKDEHGRCILCDGEDC